jgi:Serine carboxypeptidase
MSACCLQIANILFLESPQCVGFSYDESDNCLSGDNQVRVSNSLSILQWFVVTHVVSYSSSVNPFWLLCMNKNVQVFIVLLSRRS